MERDAMAGRLLALKDGAYAAFQRKLLPTVDIWRVIGVRTPALQALAKKLAGTEEAEAFLRALPHRYFDENQLHAFLISEEKDFDRCLERVETFLPYVDNWATCDQLSPAVFARRHAELLPWVRRWISGKETYTVRFGIGMLMRHFLDGDFDPAYLAWAGGVRSDEYYVNMMIAWYFATALAKQYGAALPWIEEKRLPAWTHNKAIQKAVESRRLTLEQKETLRRLRIFTRERRG